MRLSTLRAPVLVGLLVIGTIFGFLYMVSKVKKTAFEGPDTYSVVAIFEDVTGLVENSNVTMVGISVGVIESIRRVKTEEGMRARVVIRISDEVELFGGELGEDGILRGAATVTRKQSSILGDFFLSVSPGAFGDRLANGDEIPIVIGASGMEAMFGQMEQMGQLYPRLERILANVEEISAGLAAGLGGEEGKKNLQEIVGNLNEISKETRDVATRVRSVSTEIESIVQDGTFTRIANNIEDTSNDAREISDRLKQIVAAGDVEQLVTNLSETASQLNNVGLQLNELVKQGIAPRLAQLDRIFRNFERFSSFIAGFTEDNSGVLTEILVNFRDFSQQLVTFLQQGKGEVETAMGAVKGTLMSAQLSLQKMDESLENVRQITSDLREGKGTVGRLLTDDRLVEEIEEIVSDTKGFMKSYTLMQTEVQFTPSYFVLDKTWKNVFTLRFRPKEDKYYLLQIIDDPRGNIRNFDSNLTTTDPKETPEVTENHSVTTDDLKFSFQFAKQFYFLVGRFGIMENTGGFGLDFTFFRDRLQFQFDLFDFAMEGRNPRLRGTAEWEVFNHFFIAGGVDDGLNEGVRDYFLSAGIRFTDDDLKALLLAAPSVSP